MKALLIIGLGCLLAMTATPPPAQAQNIINVTKITSTTGLGGNVLLEDSANKVAISFHKGAFYAKTKGFNAGSAVFVNHYTGKIVWSGPLAGVRVVGVAANDSLKVLYIRQYLTN